MVKLFLGGVALLMVVSVAKWLRAEWNPQSWRTRRSGPENNWKNEAFMAREDGKTWQEVDAGISTDVPPRRPSGNTSRF